MKELLSSGLLPLCLFGLVVAACNKTSDAADDMICEPGEVQDCPCGGDLPDGTQSCNDDGTGWGDCDCGSSDTDVDTDTDSDTDTDTDADTDTDTNTGTDTDTDTDTDTGTAGLYLVSVDIESAVNRLLKIDVETGIGEEVCELWPSPYSTDCYNSLTFSRDGGLFLANCSSDTIDLVDACTCEVTPIGPHGYETIPGITADYGINLFGLERDLDVLVAIDSTSAVGSTVGSLGVNFDFSGLTWSDELDEPNGGIYAINGGTEGDNWLYTIDRYTGEATGEVEISGVEFWAVGVELHPSNGVIYGCTTDAVLYSIDPETGVAEAIGSGMGHEGYCNNLAAPWTVVSCLEEL